MNSSSEKPKSILADSDQAVSFAELFFDLVFVFSITQVVHLLHDGFDWPHVGRVILVFWLVWWAWTQFTWALNAADTTHQWIQFGTLMATALAFFMAIGVPESFSSQALWFAVSYVAVRSIGLLIYLWVSWADLKMRAAVKLFSALSILGLMAVIAGGILGGTSQYWLWGLGIALDIMAASLGGNSDGWNLHPGHFAERHGLFIIIALGETLIIAAGGISSVSWNPSLLTVAVLSVGISGCFWWIYFSKAKDKLEHIMSQKKDADQSAMARDTYSLFHFPMLFGLIVYAYAINECISHPDQPLSVNGRIALALGILCFSGGLIIVMWRATGKIDWIKLGLTLITTGLVLGISHVVVIWTMLAAFGGMLVLCILEEIIPLEEHL
jgi:low temperature requirement protein LtrA